MNSQWQIDLYDGLNNAIDMQDVLDVTLKIVKPIGFSHVGWRAKLPISMTQHRFSLLNTDEDKIHQQRIKGAYDDAPIPRHCSQSMVPISWQGTTTDATFSKAPELWEDYYSEGHYGGWAQSVIESKNMFSMMYVDSDVPWLQKDLDHIDFKMQWITMAVLSKMNQFRQNHSVQLSLREKEILRWTGDGKNASDIGMILNISHSTVNFHLYNAMCKLDAPNKTSAVVKAIFLRLLL